MDFSFVVLHCWGDSERATRTILAQFNPSNNARRVGRSGAFVAIDVIAAKASLLLGGFDAAAGTTVCEAQGDGVTWAQLRAVGDDPAFAIADDAVAARKCRLRIECDQ